MCEPKKPRRIDLERVWPFSCYNTNKNNSLRVRAFFTPDFKPECESKNYSLSTCGGMYIYKITAGPPRKALNLCISCVLLKDACAFVITQRRGKYFWCCLTCTFQGLIGRYRGCGGPFVVHLTQNTPPPLHLLRENFMRALASFWKFPTCARGLSIQVQINQEHEPWQNRPKIFTASEKQSGRPMDLVRL